ncbi:hypothetical protein WH87_05860 [Devosia epidermidihirudinis]|uniref:Uncharacterized protein n=2 Tax=Devosia epidermidihirudinis TaxID=1293439 RepID=A0A0F5QG50_9HYPH|nr:hypothetical protein WH87_05860 [Devosia epidermidihirudinis]
MPDGRVLLVGPPPYNLGKAIRQSQITSWPGGTLLKPRFYSSESVMITELSGVAEAATTIRVALPDGQSFQLPIGANSVGRFAGRRVLFTMSKDNDLAWITEWTRYHAKMQSADAVVFFDNGSSRYDPAEIAGAIQAGGIDLAAVHSWPYVYGAPDPAVRLNPFYTQFLQVGSMSVMLRRYGMAAFGLLNCDIDELAATPEGTTIFDLADQSKQGLIVMRGRYIEPIADASSPAQARTHRHYSHFLADPARALSRPKKWALQPTRPWVRNLAVHPYMHWIENRPWFSKETPSGVFYRHFRAIHTNWKDQRTETGHLASEALLRDADFADLVAREQF